MNRPEPHAVNAAQLRVAADAARSWPGASAPRARWFQVSAGWQPEPAARLNA
jgi:hypothetical protein